MILKEKLDFHQMIEVEKPNLLCRGSVLKYNFLNKEHQKCFETGFV